MAATPTSQKCALASKMGWIQLISWLLLAAWMSGCAERKTPDLLELERLEPGALEPDTEVEITGNGFPAHRRGTLILSGVAHTPARPPREVTWELPIVADSRSTIFLRPNARTLRELTKGAEHITFRGDARVKFSPLVEGRPALRGKKTGVVLDLFVPSGNGKSEDAESFMAFLGIELDANLVVRDVTEGSAAERAGLQVGDHLRVLDSVRLDSARDFLPQAHARTSVVQYTRDGYRGLGSAHVDRADFQLLEGGLAARAIALLAGVALALLWCARPPRFLLWIFGERSRARRTRPVWLSDVGPRSQFIAYPIFLAVVLGYFGLLSGLGEVSAGTQLIAAIACGAILLLTASFLLGGRRSRVAGFSLLSALISTALRVLVLLPALIACVNRASEAGSLDLGELAATQGTWPAQWAWFTSPFSFLLGLAFLVALVPLSGRRAPLEGHRPPTGRIIVVARSAEWAGQLVLLGLWVLLFAGGALGPHDSSIAGGVLFSAKVATLAAAMAWVRARSGHVRLTESWGLFGLANVGLSVFAAALAFGSLASGLYDLHAELLGLFAATLAASLMILVFIGSQRSWAHMGRRIDPWI